MIGFAISSKITNNRTTRAPKGEFRITGFEIRMIEIMSEIGIMGFHTKPNFNLLLGDYTPDEIGNTGLQPQ